MTNLTIDLSKQEYPVFNIGENHTLDLRPINFIFGRNGSGKSSLANLISQQFDDTEEYSVHVFTGMHDLLVDDKLNAVVLGKENKEAKIEIDRIDRDLASCSGTLDDLETALKALIWKPEYEELGVDKNPLFVSKKITEQEYKLKEQLIDAFYTYGAKKVREFSLNIKLFSGSSYVKNNFEREIQRATRLSDKELAQCVAQLGDNPKEKLKPYHEIHHNYEELLDNVNEVITRELTQIESLPEFKDNPQKQNFAMQGRKLHKPDEVCAFCGNIYTKQRDDKLGKFLSMEELKEINNDLELLLKRTNSFLLEIDQIGEPKALSFYSFLSDEVSDVILEFKHAQSSIRSHLRYVENELNEKRRDLFSRRSPLSERIPVSIDATIKHINILIDRHNNHTDSFIDQQNKARDKIRFHVIAEIIEDLEKYPFKKGWRGYVAESSDLKNLAERAVNERRVFEQEVAKTETSISDVKEGIARLEGDRKKQLARTQNTEYLASVINHKLFNSGKQDLKLSVRRLEDDVEHYMILDEKNGMRDISKVSAGEKNIIAFLYFIGYLRSLDRRQKKIIIFDDPMTSNDDTMQYLIITELQRLYRGIESIFDRNRDCFVCMTHNVHFYLNVQPQGSRKDEHGRTKYDKNNFFIIRNQTFFRVEKEEDDFKTHYEALWMELNDLYESGHMNSMLNSMRRIVETFIKFNKIHPDHFYKEKDEHRKMFDVHSHAAIDELSADAIGKTKEQLCEMFKNLFTENDFKDHFYTYWKQ